MIETVSAAISLLAGAKSGVTLIDRVIQARQAGLDQTAIKRLAVLEARRNAKILDVALHLKEKLPIAQMWHAAASLQTAALEVMLGTGKPATGALSVFSKVKPEEHDETTGQDLAESLYVRIQTLQALASLNQRGALQRVALARRLDNLSKDLVKFIKAGTPTRKATTTKKGS